MKGLTRLRAHDSGLCKLPDGTIAWYARSGKDEYFLPMQVPVDPYEEELKRYLDLKYGDDVREAFMDFGMELVRSYFDDDNNLLREEVQAAVEEFLEGLRETSTAGS